MQLWRMSFLYIMSFLKIHKPRMHIKCDLHICFNPLLIMKFTLSKNMTFALFHQDIYLVVYTISRKNNSSLRRKPFPAENLCNKFFKGESARSKLQHSLAKRIPYSCRIFIFFEDGVRMLVNLRSLHSVVKLCDDMIYN